MSSDLGKGFKPKGEFVVMLVSRAGEGCGPAGDRCSHRSHRRCESSKEMALLT